MQHASISKKQITIDLYIIFYIEYSVLTKLKI